MGRITTLFALFAALAIAQDTPHAFDPITKPGKFENVTAGTTYTIEWKVDDTFPNGPVTVILAGGPEVPQKLQQIGSPLASEYSVGWTLQTGSC